MPKKMQGFEMEGIEVVDIKKIVDERGFFAEAIRKDWSHLLPEEWISQANISYSYPGIIRAWHRHTRGQIDYFFGTARLNEDCRL